MDINDPKYAMKYCKTSYRNCLLDCRPSEPRICKYVCDDKMRDCLGDVAKKFGNNNLWPHQNANYNDVPYIAVTDQDFSFKTPRQNYEIPFQLILRCVLDCY